MVCNEHCDCVSVIEFKFSIIIYHLSYFSTWFVVIKYNSSIGPFHFWIFKRKLTKMLKVKFFQSSFEFLKILLFNKHGCSLFENFLRIFSYLFFRLFLNWQLLCFKKIFLTFTFLMVKLWKRWIHIIRYPVLWGLFLWGFNWRLLECQFIF